MTIVNEDKYLVGALEDNLGLGLAPAKNNALSNKIISILSQSYTDSDIRDAIRYLDDKGIRNTADTRRKLRLDVQREVIRRNGEIIKDFGNVAEVSNGP